MNRINLSYLLAGLAALCVGGGLACMFEFYLYTLGLVAGAVLEFFAGVVATIAWNEYHYDGFFKITQEAE